eukprot:s802_g11.t1
MSLFPSTLTRRILDDSDTPPPVIELQGISAGQLSLVFTEPQTEHTAVQDGTSIVHEDRIFAHCGAGSSASLDHVIGRKNRGRGCGRMGVRTIDPTTIHRFTAGPTAHRFTNSPRVPPLTDSPIHQFTVGAVV